MKALFYSQANYKFAGRGWGHNLGFIFIFPQCVTHDTLTSLSGELYRAIKIKIYYFNKHKENKHFNPKAWINSFSRHYIFMNEALLVKMKKTKKVKFIETFIFLFTTPTIYFYIVYKINVNVYKFQNGSSNYDFYELCMWEMKQLKEEDWIMSRLWVDTKWGRNEISEACAINSCTDRITSGDIQQPSCWISPRNEEKYAYKYGIYWFSEIYRLYEMQVNEMRLCDATRKKLSYQLSQVLE